MNGVALLVKTIYPACVAGPDFCTARQVARIYKELWLAGGNYDADLRTTNMKGDMNLKHSVLLHNNDSGV